MPADAALPETLIGRVALRTPQAGPDDHRPDVAGILDRSDFTVPGLPAAAVLIVRRLACSLPSGGRARSPGFVPGLDLRDRTAELARLAARPDRERVPEDAPAVLFSDRARMLACLADDLARGLAERCWWWQLPLRRLAGGRAGPAAVGEVLAADPTSVPAAVDHLARGGRLAPVFAALSPAQAERAATALAQAHGLAEDAASGTPAAGPLDAGPRAGDGRAPDASATAASAPRARFEGLAAALRRIAAEAALVDRPAPARLAALALTLHRHAGLVPEPGFAAALAVWPRTPVIERVPTDGGNRPPRPGSAATVEAPPARDRAGDGAATFEPLAAIAPPHEEPAEPKRPPEVGPATAAELPPTGRAALEPSDAGARPADGAGAGKYPEAPPSPPAAADAAAARRSSPAPPSAAAPAGVAAPPPSPDAGDPDTALEGIPSRIAGVLFLVNVITALDLPGCFAPTWPLGRAVGHWGVLSGLARALAADLEEDVDSDPVWPALAALCPEPELELLDAAAPLTVPPAWRAWAPPEADPPVPPQTLPPFDRWLAFVVPLLRRRVAMALGVAPADAGRRLLRRHGRLHVNGPHVELVMSLDDADVAVRLAGLDRDPGWHPGFGRVILFHYR
jgi:hypothetical protein